MSCDISISCGWWLVKHIEYTTVNVRIIIIEILKKSMC